MRNLICVLFLLLVAQNASAGSMNEYEYECNETVIKMCQEPGQDTTGVCELLTTDGRETPDSIYEFIYGIRHISETNRRLFICARLMGQEVVIEGKHYYDNSDRCYHYLDTEGVVTFLVRKRNKSAGYSGYADDWHEWPEESLFSNIGWLIAVPVDEEIYDCVIETNKDLGLLQSGHTLDIHAKVVGVIKGISVDWGRNWEPISLTIFLEAKTVIAITTVVSSQDLEEACDILREELRTEQRRIYNLGR